MKFWGAEEELPENQGQQPGDWEEDDRNSQRSS